MEYQSDNINGVCVRHTLESDIDRIMDIYDYARLRMRQSGNGSQWVNGYPSCAVIKSDMDKHSSYVIAEDGNLTGVFTFATGIEPNYSYIDGCWPDSDLYGTVHRIAAAPGAKGIADIAFDFCRRAGVNIRIDTHADNAPMLAWLKKRGFIYCGVIYVADGTARKAFQWTNTAHKGNGIEIREILTGKNDFKDLLLIGDEQSDMIDRYLDRCRLFIAFAGDTPISCCAVCEEQDRMIEIKNLAVKPGYRKRGIGREMLSHVEAMHRNSTIFLGTGETPSTLRFYKNCGYTYSHTIPDFFTENYNHQIEEEGVILKDMIYLKKNISNS